MAAPSVAPLPAPLAAAPRVSNPSSAPAQQKPLPALGKAAANQPSSALSTSVGKKMPQASSSPEQVAASTASTSDEYYFVLLNSGSESALEQARTVVPDAYVRDFPQGTLIQMGAFKRESEAKTLVEELKQQGIFASIYRP
jgi:cell division septation protein DedD